jgi:hypothetical protein
MQAPLIVGERNSSPTQPTIASHPRGVILPCRVGNGPTILWPLLLKGMGGWGRPWRIVGPARKGTIEQLLLGGWGGLHVRAGGGPLQFYGSYSWPRPQPICPTPTGPSLENWGLELQR